MSLRVVQDDLIYLTQNVHFVSQFWIYAPLWSVSIILKRRASFFVVVFAARCILFLIIWLITGGRHHFWFLPNLTADVGFIDSFRPLYTHEYKGPKADSKKEEKLESKKQPKSDSDEKSDTEKKEDEDGKADPLGAFGSEGPGGARHSDTDSDRREDDRSQHSSGNGNDFEMITKEELDQQTDEGDCEDDDDEEEEEEGEPGPLHEQS